MTTALVPREENALAEISQNNQDLAVARLLEWAKGADAAYKIAQKVVGTAMVPVAYRNKPDEGAAAIMAGAELGFSPLASLRAFDNIQGTPAPKAITLRAVVQSHGHQIVMVESRADFCKMKGRRKGEGDDAWQFVEWDIPRAGGLGLLGKDQWKKQPKTMLVARATSELCRLVAADAIMGMPYSAEEIIDGEFIDGGPVMATAQRITTAADIIGDTPPAAIQAASSARPAPVVDRNPAPAIEGEVTSNHPVSGPPADTITPKQRSMMFALFAQKGMTKPAGQRTYISEVLQRPAQSRAALSKDDAKTLIDHLNELPDLPADEPETGGDWPTPAEIPGGES